MKMLKNNKLKKALDMESDDLRSPDINVQDDIPVAFSNNNDTANSPKSKIEPLSVIYMQQNTKK